MKKIVSLISCALILVSLFAVVGCSSAPATLKFGSAIYVSAPTATDASGWIRISGL